MQTHTRLINSKYHQNMDTLLLFKLLLLLTHILLNQVTLIVSYKCFVSKEYFSNELKAVSLYLSLALLENLS